MEATSNVQGDAPPPEENTSGINIGDDGDQLTPNARLSAFRCSITYSTAVRTARLKQTAPFDLKVPLRYTVLPDTGTEEPTCEASRPALQASLAVRP